MDKDMTLKEAILDMLITMVLMISSWFTNEMSDLLFPTGIPFSDSVPIYTRTIIGYLWSIRMIVRYSVITYNEINNAIMTVGQSQMWTTGQVAVVGCLKYLLKCWKQMNSFPRYLMILLLVIGLSLALYTLTQNLADLWLPPTYSVAALLFVYLFGRENFSQRSISRYWIIILILFCVLQIAMSIGVVDLFYTASPNLFVELWELILGLPTTQLSFDNNLRVLVSMSTMYLLFHNIYQNLDIDLVTCTENLKKRLETLSSSQNSWTLGVAW